MTDPRDARIAQLEDEARQKDARIVELRRDLDEERQLVEQMREHVQDARDVIENWKEGFDMQLNADGDWTFGPWMDKMDKAFDECIALRKKWNKFVPNYNAVILRRPAGRPLAASVAQQARVLALHKAARSLRAIAAETGLGLATVRTIIGKASGTDRASKRRGGAMARIPIDRHEMKVEQRRQRTRDTIPKRIGELDKSGRELMRRAGISAKG